jgi:hypothetical protein
MSHERLAQVIQLTGERCSPTRKPWPRMRRCCVSCRGDTGEITVAQCVRLLRYQAVLVCALQNTLRQGGTE